MVPKESGLNQSVAASACAHAKHNVFHSCPPWKGMVKLYKYSIFVIMETQFAIQSQVT